jgi:hypothetical protein
MSEGKVQADGLNGSLEVRTGEDGASSVEKAAAAGKRL